MRHSRRSHRSKRTRLLAEINVVPYIDVMLVLLVIFMITAPLLKAGVNVNLPEAKAKTISVQKGIPMILSVDSAGRYFLNVSQYPSQPLSSQSLMTQVAARLQIARQRHQTTPIYVKGDRFVNYGKVVQAMALLQKAGATQVGLMTQPVGE